MDKELMSLSEYEMGMLDGIAQLKDELADNINGKMAKLIDEYHSTLQDRFVAQHRSVNEHEVTQ